MDNSTQPNPMDRAHRTELVLDDHPVSTSLRDPDAFDIAIDQHFDTLYQYIAKVLSANAPQFPDADVDVADHAAATAADAVVAAFEQRRTYRPERGTVRSWLLGVGAAVVAERVARAADVPGAASDAAQGSASLGVALRQLSATERGALMLREWAGLSDSEVAAALRVSPAEAASWLHRAADQAAATAYLGEPAATGQPSHASLLAAIRQTPSAPDAVVASAKLVASQRLASAMSKSGSRLGRVTKGPIRGWWLAGGAAAAVMVAVVWAVASGAFRGDGSSPVAGATGSIPSTSHATPGASTRAATSTGSAKVGTDTAAVDLATLPEPPPIPVDVFGMVSVEEEQTFRFAFDLAAYACDRDSRDDRPVRRSLDVLKATRMQSHLIDFHHYGQAEVDFITAVAMSSVSAASYDPELSLSDDAHWWPEACEAEAREAILGDVNANLPPLARNFTQMSGALTKFLQAVHDHPSVTDEREKFLQCYKEISLAQTSQSEADFSYVERNAEGAPIRVWLPEALACKAKTQLEKAVRIAQWDWLKKNPEVLKTWQGDRAYYKSKLPAAERIIKNLEHRWPAPSPSTP